MRDGQILSFAGYEFQVIHTAGHTRVDVVISVASEHVLFSGDTLFQNSVGRSDFPNSSTSDLIRSVRRSFCSFRTIRWYIPDIWGRLPSAMSGITIHICRGHIC